MLSPSCFRLRNPTKYIIIIIIIQTVINATNNCVQLTRVYNMYIPSERYIYFICIKQINQRTVVVVVVPAGSVFNSKTILRKIIFLTAIIRSRSRSRRRHRRRPSLGVFAEHNNASTTVLLKCLETVTSAAAQTFSLVVWPIFKSYECVRLYYCNIYISQTPCVTNASRWRFIIVMAGLSSREKRGTNFIFRNDI